MPTKWRYKVPIDQIVDFERDASEMGRRIAEKLRSADIDDGDIQEALDEFAERFEVSESLEGINEILDELYDYGDGHGVWFAKDESGDEPDSDDDDDDSDDDDDDDDSDEEE